VLRFLALLHVVILAEVKMLQNLVAIAEKQKSLGGHSQSSLKKKLVTVLEHMKNQSSKLLKKQIQM